MIETNYPSGPWTGFFTYSFLANRKFRMDLLLTFANGIVTGEGNDSVGPFILKGRYDDPPGECYWTKTYVGAHDVYYRGFREGKGIWGLWEIHSWWRGGFHVWPIGEVEAEKWVAEIDETVPTEAIGHSARR